MSEELAQTMDLGASVEEGEEVVEVETPSLADELDNKDKEGEEVRTERLESSWITKTRRERR